MDHKKNLLTVCHICFNYVSSSEFNDHKAKCKKDEMLLTLLQHEAIKYAEKKSKIISKNVYLMVLAKYKFLGYTEDDLKTTINYIKTLVPVIIHLNLDRVLSFLCIDAEYRNQFETGVNGGQLNKELRLLWEKTLFNGIYIMKVMDMKK